MRRQKKSTESTVTTARAVVHLRSVREAPALRRQGGGVAEEEHEQSQGDEDGGVAAVISLLRMTGPKMTSAQTKAHVAATARIPLLSRRDHWRSPPLTIRCETAAVTK